MYREITFDYARVGRSVMLVALIAAGMGTAVFIFVPYVSSIVTLAGVIALGVCIWGSLIAFSGLVDPRETLALLT